MIEGWETSAQAWIDFMGARGDWGREHVLDPVMNDRVASGRFRNALDVGCGEGRFCRRLKCVAAIGIDPTQRLLETARQRDPSGDYRLGRAEQLAFDDASFDLVVSYVTLVDIPDYRAGIRRDGQGAEAWRFAADCEPDRLHLRLRRPGMGEGRGRATPALSARSISRRIFLLDRMGRHPHQELAPAAVSLHVSGFWPLGLRRSSRYRASKAPAPLKIMA